MLKKITALFFITLIIFLSFYLLLGVYFNASKFADDFLKKAADETGIKVDYNRLHFTLIPRPSIILSDIMISETENARKIISAKRLRISLKITGLIIGKVSPATIIIDSPSIAVERNKKGNILLPAFLKKNGTSPGRGKPEKKSTPLSFADSFEILNGSLVFSDKSLIPAQTFIVSGIDLNLNKKFFSDDHSLNMSFLCKNEISNPSFIEVKGKTGNIDLKNILATPLDLNVKIRSLELNALWQYLSELLPFEDIADKFDANLRLQSDKLKEGFLLSGNLSIDNLNFIHKRLFQQPLISNKALIDFSLEEKPGSLNITKYTVRLDSFTVKGAVGFRRINENESNLYLQFSADDFPYDDYGKTFIPFNIFKPSLRNFMSERIRGGRINLKNLEINAHLKKDKSHKYPKNPDFLTLDATGKGVSLLFGDKFRFKPVLVNSGTIKIENGDVKFLNSDGKYGKGDWKLLQGGIKDLYRGGNLSVKAQGILPTEEIADFLREGPLPKRVREESLKVDASLGTGTITLNIDKKLADRASPLNYSGSFIIDNIKGYHRDFKSQFNIKNAAVNFSNRRTELNIKEIDYLNSHILLSGVIVPESGKNSKFYSSISIEGSLSSPLLKEMSDKLNLRDMNFEGFARFKSILEQHGDDNIDYKVESDITDLAISYKDMFTKNAIQPSLLNIYFNLAGKNLLIKKGSHIDIGNNVFTIKGRYEKEKEYPLKLTVSSKGLDVSSLSKNIPPLAKISPEGSSDIRVNLDVINSSSFRAKTKAKLKKISSKAGILSFVRKATGVIEKNADHIVFRDFNVKALSSSFNIDGGIDNTKDNSNVVLNIRTDSLNLDKLIKKYPAPKPRHSSSRGKGKALSFDCMVNAGETIFLENSYKNTVADFSYAKNQIKLGKVESSAFDGNLDLSGNIVFSNNKESSFDACFKSEKNDIGQLLEYLGIKGSEITGKIKTSNCIDSEWKTGKDIKPNLSGKISFSSENGKIKKTSIGVLSKILSFFNVFKWKDFWIKDIETKGMTYNVISADFTGSNGMFHTDNFVLDGSSMKISAVGDIDVGKNTIDMKVAVMPLGTIDSVVSNIPIVGYILTGKNKSLVGAYFEVTGNVKDPVVKAVSMKSLGKGLLGIFRRSLGFPYDMIKEIGKNTEETSKENHSKSPQ